MHIEKDFVLDITFLLNVKLADQLITLRKMKNIKQLSVASLLVLSTVVVSGCAPVLIGSATVAGASVVADRRTAGAVANDGLIETKSALHLGQTQFTSSHITTTSFNGNVLLTGEIGTQEDKEKAGEIVKSIADVNTVYNELLIGDNASISSRMSDSITASKVRAALLDNKQITLTSLKVVVERGICYLIGMETREEADIIAKIASQVPGVEKVVCLFTIITPEELERRRMITPQEENKAEAAEQNSEAPAPESDTAVSEPVTM